jgi:hypothetical protein
MRVTVRRYNPLLQIDFDAACAPGVPFKTGRRGTDRAALLPMGKRISAHSEWHARSDATPPGHKVRLSGSVNKVRINRAPHRPNKGGKRSIGKWND